MSWNGPHVSHKELFDPKFCASKGDLYDLILLQSFLHHIFCLTLDNSFNKQEYLLWCNAFVWKPEILCCDVISYRDILISCNNFMAVPPWDKHTAMVWRSANAGGPSGARRRTSSRSRGGWAKATNLVWLPSYKSKHLNLSASHLLLTYGWRMLFFGASVKTDFS